MMNQIISNNLMKPLLFLIKWNNRPRCKNCNKPIILRGFKWQHKNGKYLCYDSESNIYDVAENKGNL